MRECESESERARVRERERAGRRKVDVSVEGQRGSAGELQGSCWTGWRQQILEGGCAERHECIGVLEGGCAREARVHRCTGRGLRKRGTSASVYWKGAAQERHECIGVLSVLGTVVLVRE